MPRKTVKQLETELEEQKKKLIKLCKELEKLKKGQAQPPDDTDSGPLEILYGLPDAPHQHLLIFADDRHEILASQEAVNAWINNPGKERPAEIWEMKKRTIVPA